MVTYKAEIFHSIDFTESKLNHVSISGGKATHSFNHVDTMEAKTLKELKRLVQKKYGEFYDFHEDCAYISVEESEWQEVDCHENYSVYVTKVSETKIKVD